MAQRLIVGVTGASGVIYGVRALEMLAAPPIVRHLNATRARSAQRGKGRGGKRARAHRAASAPRTCRVLNG